MHENNENDLSLFKLKKLPQFPRLTSLNLNISLEKHSEECEKPEYKESHPKCKKKKPRDTLPQNVNNENTIIFQLGSSISKKKCVDVLKKKEIVTEKNHYSPKNDNIEETNNTQQKTKEELLQIGKNHSIESIQNIYQKILMVSIEMNESRESSSKEISNMITEINQIKESLVDYWIELTLTQAKSMNNNLESNSDADTVLNQALTKQE
ncbi:hypothetical protein [Cryptosporidium parvum Iowa II]|uniref:Uncharacterized protein n=2 Tax=Cryptosporidium parvum TaxID=5807 RepID=Q5CUZ0_CRYPI|nr:hypothetical protein [Cryptosporidium parvum Iowa II]EAK89173.1 hypothetical protein cgd3_940 [Cryptosporidium parvum Iowa II]QOY42444.1 Uncharacterized protein CPATCC_0031900 [Cryptosporidium parvum]WKS76837.1 hypothetical protein CPCDC_3g940 [Cryptosporidium sp. 43IA8]WRK31329.1 Uncharacterized protein cpbgf_300945 [Cryptosporidium parvum]|eukprot:QOY42444.1 hypothetical protein CPATCC_001080 [Cryptosporidium parvum]